MSAPQLPASAVDFVPHRPPMLLVARLLEADGGNGLVDAELGPDCPFLDAAGRFEPAGFVELCAQAYAAVKGYEFKRAGMPFGAGFLVGVQGFAVLGGAARGDVLRVEVRTTGTFEVFAVVQGTVTRGSETLAEGRIKLYAPSCSGGGT